MSWADIDRLKPIRGLYVPKTYSVRVHDTEDQIRIEHASRIFGHRSYGSFILTATLAWLDIIDRERAEREGGEGSCPEQS